MSSPESTPLFTEDGEDWDDLQTRDSPIPDQAQIYDLVRSPTQNTDSIILNEPENLKPISETNDIFGQTSTVLDINFAFLKNQARYFCVYSLGPLGIGKTSYAIKCLQQLYGDYDYNGELIKECNDWETIEAHIVFHPQTFKRIIQHLQKTKTRIKALVWDDSGIFLAAKDWQKAWAKEIVKYFQLARTYCSSIILTTPSPSLILKDIRRLNMVTINIEAVKTTLGRNFNNARIAKSYDHWYLPDLTKPRLKFRGFDSFNVMLPDSIYKPYQKMRSKYADFELDKVFEIIGEDGADMVNDINFDKLARSR